ncbi:class I SAM-dependent methyltransferase [Rhodobacter sp. SY28-1]|uniref:class I SAM-dependent methyltransferase n=1 Tax=Rhodobacter sp. SY28-1 TaxID=2562317 RepID=UPI0010C0931E|nr:class I SAM-dependent methyltransferase [Rhodobacter sp. SY28-1]
MQTGTDIVAEFAARPWAAVTLADLGPAARVPTMLTPEESQLYHWLGRRVQGDGAVVDLGAYAGGSAARLLSGLAAAGRANPVHSYDRFRSSRAFWARFMPDEPLPEADDADLLPVVRRHLAPWGDQVVLHVGDIGDKQWAGGPIEILSVDAAKGSGMADHIAAEFFPMLVPGRSVVVQQDYLMAVQPWLCAQMVGMRDQFQPLAHVPKVGLVFLCVAPVTRAALAGGRVHDLTDGKLMQRVRAAADWHEGMVPRGRFKAMLEQIKAHPGVRLGWQMKQAAAQPKG